MGKVTERKVKVGQYRTRDHETKNRVRASVVRSEVQDFIQSFLLRHDGVLELEIVRFEVMGHRARGPSEIDKPIAKGASKVRVPETTGTSARMASRGTIREDLASRTHD
jgi:hypothetical protein